MLLLAGRRSSAEVATNSVPVIDISDLRLDNSTHEQRLAVAKQIGAACENVGFFVVKNHAVPRATIGQAWATTTQFFDQPLAVKLGPESHLLMTGVRSGGVVCGVWVWV